MTEAPQIVRAAAAAVTDHGALTGLADDDHPQYGRTDTDLSQFAATTSAQLAGVISDETGTGALVFANTPTLVTPEIGAATGTSLVLGSGAEATPALAVGASGHGLYFDTALRVSVSGSQVASFASSGNFVATGDITATDDVIASDQLRGVRAALAGNVTAAAWGTTGVRLSSDARTYTDSSSAGTVATNVVASFAQSTLAADLATTYTDAAEVYIAAAPTAGTNVTLTNSWSLWVDAGASRFDGQIVSKVSGGTAPFTVDSTTLVTNLNADLLDGNEASAFALSSHSHEGTAILSTGEVGGSKFLREDGDGTCSWQTLTEADISDLGNYAVIGGAHHDGFSDYVANEHIDWTGASSAFSTAVAGLAATIQNTTDAASNQVAIFKGGNRSTPTDADEAYHSFYLDDSTGTQVEFARMTWVAADVTNTTKDAELKLAIHRNNTLEDKLIITDVRTKLNWTGSLTPLYNNQGVQIECGNNQGITLASTATGNTVSFFDIQTAAARLASGVYDGSTDELRLASVESGGSIKFQTGGYNTRLTIASDGQITSYLNNASTTPQLLIEQDSSGDAALSFLLTAGQQYSIGIDNSDSDMLLFSAGANVHTSTFWKVDTNGIIDFRGTMGNGSSDPTSNSPSDWVEIKIAGTSYYLPAYT